MNEGFTAQGGSSATCGDEICTVDSESYATCPSDCPAQTGLSLAVPGGARDVVGGTDGSIWAVSNTLVSGTDYLVYKWNGSSWAQDSTRYAAQITLDANNNPWRIRADFARALSAGTWLNITNPTGVTAVTAIGSGADGSIAMVVSGGAVYTLPPAKVSTPATIVATDWVNRGGNATKVDVDATGHPWIVTAGAISKWSSGTTWTPVTGPGVTVVDIGISKTADGTVFVAGSDGKVYSRKADGTWLTCRRHHQRLGDRRNRHARWPTGLGHRDQRRLRAVGRAPSFTAPKPSARGWLQKPSLLSRSRRHGKDGWARRRHDSRHARRAPQSHIGKGNEPRGTVARARALRRGSSTPLGWDSLRTPSSLVFRGKMG